MDTTTRSASPLRQRMLDDMRMRKLEPRTQEGYIRVLHQLEEQRIADGADQPPAETPAAREAIKADAPVGLGSFIRAARRWIQKHLSR
jgi:hypothetical protein